MSEAMSKNFIKEVDAHVGRLVRERRRAILMSQEKLGEVIGITFQQVQKYENGKNRISSSRLMQIGNALGVEPAYFFVGAPTATRFTSNQKEMKYVADFVTSKEGNKLMKAFARLTKDIQRCVVTLVEKIADNE